MKKDYMPVTEEKSELSESNFIDQYWTQIWESGIPNYATGMVENQERFEIMRPFVSALPSQSRILDGGCGLGEWTLYFSSKGFETVGLDLSRTTIAKLKKKFPQCDFRAGDIRKTDFENDYFDLYFSWGTFEHFENGFEEPLAEARRILKVGGHLLITIPFQNHRHIRRDQRPLHLWGDGYKKNKGYESQMRFYQWRLNQSELQREFEINGLKTDLL
jgi:SAM-dependent methyltransferase